MLQKDGPGRNRKHTRL